MDSASKGHARTGGRNTAAKIAVKDRQAKALELRRSGMSYPAIAAELGYRHPTGALHAVEAALRRAIQEPAAEVRQLEVDRLDRLMLAWWKLGTADPPDKDAAEMVMKYMARRAKLLGLDAPVKVAPTKADGTDLPAPKVLTREEFNQLADDDRLLYLRGQLTFRLAEGVNGQAHD